MLFETGQRDKLALLECARRRGPSREADSSPGTKLTLAKDVPLAPAAGDSGRMSNGAGIVRCTKLRRQGTSAPQV